MESLVARRCLPEGDVATQLKTLQGIVTKKLDWARKCTSVDVDRAIYLSFIGLLGASLYTFSPQGRTSGIEDMKMSQVPALIQDGFAQSSVFKTNAKYGYQPVSLSLISMELLTLFVKEVRPAATNSNPILGSDPYNLKIGSIN